MTFSAIKSRVKNLLRLVWTNIFQLNIMEWDYIYPKYNDKKEERKKLLILSNILLIVKINNRKLIMQQQKKDASR